MSRKLFGNIEYLTIAFTLLWLINFIVMWLRGHICHLTQYWNLVLRDPNNSILTVIITFPTDSLDDSIGSLSIASPICNGTLLCIRVQVINDAMIKSWRLFGPPAAQQPSHDNSAPAVAAPPVTCEVDVQTGEIGLSCIYGEMCTSDRFESWSELLMSTTNRT